MYTGFWPANLQEGKGAFGGLKRGREDNNNTIRLQETKVWCGLDSSG